jgi:aminopeptidase N
VQAARVRIDVFAPAGHSGLARSQAESLQRGLTRLAALLGPYPYGRLVLVLPPKAGAGAAGMEYPGLIVGWTASWHTECSPWARVVHDLVTSHELAHQWFPMLVASNEVQAPVLDEGLAEWLALDLLREHYGPSFWQRITGLRFDLFDIARANSLGNAGSISSLEPAYAYHPDQLAAAVYLRPALALETIRRTWGAERFDSALGRYARAYRFGHPQLDDFLTAFDQSHWPGFGQRVLRPMLEAEPREKRVRANTPVGHSLEPTVGRPARSDAVLRPLLARLLLFAQTALAALGP